MYMIDATTIALICLIIGTICLIIEAMSPGFFMLIPGVIFIVVGMFGYFVDGFFDSWLLVATVIVAAVVTTALTIKLYQVLAKPAPPETLVAESMIGRDGMVITAVVPGNLRGKVRIGSDIWSATSEAEIEKDTEITVYAAEGVHVKVRPKNGS